jgi:membrane protein YqaA with SNARE-associated domain
LRQKLTAALLAFGPFGILLVALLDSLVIPLPAGVDVLLLTIAVKEPGRAYFAALMAVVGSTCGNLVLFEAARHGTRWFVKKDDTPSPRAERFHRWFTRYGMLTVFVPCVTPVIPFPLKVFVVSAGALRTSLGKFLAVVLFARSLRYFGEAYLGIQLGEGAEAYLRHNAWQLLGVALAMATGLYLAIRWNDRRREPVL